MTRKKRTGKYKIKTHKATAKRFRLTGSGKVVRTKGGQNSLSPTPFEAAPSVCTLRCSRLKELPTQSASSAWPLTLKKAR